MTTVSSDLKLLLSIQSIFEVTCTDNNPLSDFYFLLVGGSKPGNFLLRTVPVAGQDFSPILYADVTMLRNFQNKYHVL